MVNEYKGESINSACTKCNGQNLTESIHHYEGEVRSLSLRIESKIHIVPVVTVPSPLNWEYEIKGLVTGQSTLGTGAITELSGSIADTFGTQSGARNDKIRKGEQNCLDQIKAQCIELGGNSVIALDINYAELSSDKGLIMVAMSGTAVNLKNISSLDPEAERQLSELIELRDNLAKAKKLLAAL